MDIQKFIDSMNESQARERGNYHLTFGQLVEALEKAPVDAIVDERFKGIGSWRGSYVEIAIFTEESGLSAYNGKFDGDYEQYDSWRKENEFCINELPRNANELGKILRSIIGKDFIGYKGGNFTIAEYKPLWLTTDDSTSGDSAIVGIDKNLQFITKVLED